MRPSKITLIICSCFFISVSVITSKFLFFMNSLDSDDVHVARKNSFERHPFIGSSSENLIWFMQISDLHISIFHDPSRISEFRQFCNDTVDIVKPSVVLATGDLTDAKTADGEGSTQYEKEWIIYRDALLESKIPEKVLWLDIRGNHDNFDVLCLNSENNYFRKYSVQGANNPKSYFYTYAMNNSEKVGFLAVDACLEVGTRRPFNFVGQLTSKEMESIRSFVDQARNAGVNYLFWFGHYPTSTIEYPQSEKLRDLIANEETSVGYFCGHLHQIGGLVPRMYAFQRRGYFELELGDWRGNRMIRIMAIDHGQFSFVDAKHGSWPIVLVTNPKTVTLVRPGGDIVVPSSHIRMLIFSPVPIVNVRVQVDEDEWRECEKMSDVLFVSAWNPSKFQNGLHLITIKCEDQLGNLTTHFHEFSLDGTRIKNKFLPRFFLMSNLGVVFYSLFTNSILICSVPLIVLRFLTKYKKVNGTVLSKVRFKCWSRWIRRLCVISYLDEFFYPLVLYPVYLFTGPWAIVYLVENELGVIFSWGMIIRNTFVPSWITYPFGWIQVVLHEFLTLHLARQLDRRYYKIVKKTDLPGGHFLKRLLHLLWDNNFFIFVILIQIWDTYNFWLSYGHLTLIFCPLKTWWILMAVWLKHKAHTIKSEKLSSVHWIWLS